jgi:hypothetical protein
MVTHECKEKEQKIQVMESKRKQNKTVLRDFHAKVGGGAKDIHKMCFEQPL